MNLEPYNGTAGPTLREKLVSIVEVQTRKASPPVADLYGVLSILNYSHVMDPESDPDLVLNAACRDGDLVRVDDPPGKSRPILALPSPETFRYVLDDPDAEYITKRIERELDDESRGQYIGAMNALQQEVRGEGD